VTRLRGVAIAANDVYVLPGVDDTLLKSHVADQKSASGFGLQAEDGSNGPLGIVSISRTFCLCWRRPCQNNGRWWFFATPPADLEITSRINWITSLPVLEDLCHSCSATNSALLHVTRAGGSTTPLFSQRRRVRLLTESRRATAASVNLSLAIDWNYRHWWDDS